MLRSFVAELYEIPTGSMQPTLFGVTSVPDYSRARSQAEAQEQLALQDSLDAPFWSLHLELYGSLLVLSLTRLRAWSCGR